MNQRIMIALIAVVLVAALGVGLMTLRKSSSSVKETAAEAPIKELLDEAAQYEAQGQKLKVKEAYTKIIADYPEYEKVEEVQDKLGDLNMAIITSYTQTPQAVMHQVVPGDSLGKLSKQYNTTKELIKKSNGLKSDVIRIGQNLRIWNSPFNVMVKKGQNILVLKTGDEVVKIFHVSTGANNITPVGTFHIATKLANPVWFKPGGAPVPPESPENVLGTRWMGFDTDPHYGIHGTVEPDKIGQQVTAGCVRMRNAEVEQLFDLLPIGTQIVIQD